MTDPLPIDGSTGEGGGQILRTSLALSVITGRPFRIFNIRGNRPKPGLRRQHLTCVLAAAAISGAEVHGAEVNSREVTFTPTTPVAAGKYVFDVGSAGSTTLVLQTVLPALIGAAAVSEITLIGGTHNFGAPPFAFLQKTFLPLVNRIGPAVEARIERAGFVPRGGGRARVTITPRPLKAIAIGEQVGIRRRLARATVAGLPREIAERELKLIAPLVKLRPDEMEVEELPPDQGPGNIVTIELESADVTEVVTAFGARGVPAENVARDAANEANRYLAIGAPVGEHLADQLLLPMALAGGGTFVTGEPSLHFTTNVETIRRFIDVSITVGDAGKGLKRVEVG